MIPEAYFYLIDIETEQPLAIFPVEGIDSYSGLNAFEGRIRTDHNVDDPHSGLALRDSAAYPLHPDVARKVLRETRAARAIRHR